MVPKINSRGGRSFKGITAYLMHDSGRAQTNERVEWTMTGNLYTDDVFKAAGVMSWTDFNAEDIKIAAGGSSAGRKTEKGGVYHYSLSWAHGEKKGEEHQRSVAVATLERLGLSEHQYYVVAHNETEHDHIHIVANLTHPETGKRADLPLDKRALQEWALEYEREHGLHCTNREANAELRKQNNAKTYAQTQKERHGVQATRAYEASDDGKSFKNALELEGLRLARGRRSCVAVDEQGNIINLSRVIEDRKTVEIKAKLKDIDLRTLPDADELAEQIKLDSTPYDREAAEVEQQNNLAEAAIVAAKEKAELEDIQDKKLATQRAIDKITAENKAKRMAKDVEARRRERQIQERIEESKKLHDIDGCRQRLAEAQAETKALNGVWARLFKREQFEAALDNLQNREKQLANQTARFEADIRGIVKHKEWAVAHELERHGIAERKSVEYKTPLDHFNKAAADHEGSKQRRIREAEEQKAVETPQKTEHIFDMKDEETAARYDRIAARLQARDEERDIEQSREEDQGLER
ncbi:relaxase/mobilization nuclease-like protein [Neolewinella xylanilytica]|uniref:Relaxase/mobilization nuclease-like protein n=1 Tax=Neolewinella xylanilytica TaxID=1514080 RepID=A0A2S6HZQ8_9BACT|nr:relaxase/mobilization nuclease domain-containing protein [Neolewinella xylanilytica]PPK83931.1 relaxase/mobilization nuclease-like protein [Neolewinella xylanilytica]